MIKKQKVKMQPPISTVTKEAFINSGTNQDKLQDNLGMDKGRSQAVTFTLHEQDIRMLEHEIDRAIKLGRRNKSKSALIRMALRALQESSDEDYLNLYNRF